MIASSGRSQLTTMRRTKQSNEQAVRDDSARRFYEAEALRGGWSVRQLDRQVGSQFYERTLLSKNKSAMLRKGAEPQPADLVNPEDEIKRSIRTGVPKPQGRVFRARSGRRADPQTGRLPA